MSEEAQRNWLRRAADHVRHPATLTGLLQIVKSTVAATLAWWLAVEVLQSQQSFLAPWTALLTVHLTVSRSLVRGVQTFISSTLGVLLSLVVGIYLGVAIWTYALAILVGLLVALLPGIRKEGGAVATTAIFLLSQGFNADGPMLIDRILEVGTGVAVGVAVNLILVPPLRDHQAARLVDDLNERIGAVLDSMATEFAESWDTEQAEEWLADIERMRNDLISTWDEVEFAQESRERNPRSLMHNKKGANYKEILYRVDEGIAHLRHLARTLDESSHSSNEWDNRFREQWAEVAGSAARRIANPDAEVEPISDRLDEITREMSEGYDLPSLEWPVYGSLIASLRNIAVVVDDVASAREARDAEAD